jgi:hypothetical protein
MVSVWEYMKFWFAKDMVEFVGALTFTVIVGAFYGLFYLIQWRSDGRRN